MHDSTNPCYGLGVMALIHGIYGATILKLQDQPPIGQISPLSAPTVIDDYFFAIYFNRAILSTMNLGGLSRKSFDFNSILNIHILVVSFVYSSKMTASDTALPRFSRDIQGLEQSLTSFDLPGVNRGILESLFRGKSGAIEPGPMRELAVSDQEVLKAKESEGDRKNIVMKKYVTCSL